MTPQQIDAQFQIVRAVADAIKELTATSPLSGVPYGEFYARLMPMLTLTQLQSVVDLLKRAGLVKETNHLLTWVGPS